MACGDEHTLFLTYWSRLYVTGSNKVGQLGIGSDTQQPMSVPSPGPTPPDSARSNRSLGAVFLTALRSSSPVRSPKAAQRIPQRMRPARPTPTARLVHPPLNYVSRPVEVTALRAASVFKISAGALHSAAVAGNGELYTWGYGSSGNA